MTRLLHRMVGGEPIDPSLLSSEPLRAAVADELSVRRMWPLVLAELAGRSPWADVARQALAGNNFATAASLLSFAGQEERVALRASIVDAWRCWHEEFAGEFARIGAEADTWEQFGFNPAQYSSAQVPRR